MRHSLFSRTFARLAGAACFAVAVLCLEFLIEAGVVNRFVVPLPSDVLAAFERIIVEENVIYRFMMTAAECFAAGVLLTLVGISIGWSMFRYGAFREACETWVAAWASAPVVLMYPLFLVVFGRNVRTVVMIGFVAAVAPVILKTVEGLTRTRQVFLNVGKSFNLTPSPHGR